MVKKNKVYTLFLVGCIGLFTSCDLVQVRNEKGNLDFVYKKKSDSDSTIVLKYIFGGVYGKKNKVKNFRNMEESIVFYRNGNPQSYKLHYKGNLSYYRLYDENGTAIKAEGSAIIGEDSITTDTVFVGKNYWRDVYFVQPPNSKIEVMVGEYVKNPKTRDLKKHPLFLHEVINSKITYNCTFDTLGVKKQILYWGVEDSLSNFFQKGSAIHQYVVIP